MVKRYIPVPVAIPKNFKEWPDILLYSALIWGEARGEPKEGKIAVAWVVRNRFIKGGWYGSTLKEVILKPYQFSCFLKSDPNKRKMLNPLAYDSFDIWKECYDIAERVNQGELEDPTNGATHYHSKYMKIYPRWTRKMIKTCEIGSHIFYKEA